MLKFTFLTAFFVFALVPSGNAIKCYHCYDAFNRTSMLENSLSLHSYGEKFVRCEKIQSQWNTWDCPARWPVCIVTSAKVGNHREIVRSCGERDFCSKYIPPLNVKIETCRECSKDICNDELIEPFPDPLFTFNFNINLNVKRLFSSSLAAKDEN